MLHHHFARVRSAGRQSGNPAGAAVESLERRAYFTGTLSSAPIFSNAGPTTQGLAQADFNGDGKPDLAVTNFKTGTVSVLLGKGDGSFQHPKAFKAGPHLSGLTAADVNQDGKPDLIAIGDTAFVFLNQGNGKFGSGTSLTVGDTPQNVLSADIDGDGNADLLVANVFTNDVSVLLGHGDGTFAAAVSVPAIMGAADVAVGDFNGDGVLDIAVTGLGDLSGTGTSAGVAILLGQGGGAFSAPVIVQAGIAPIHVEAVDLNGDGVLDLAVANGGLGTNAPGSDNISVLLGHGDGTFAAAVDYATPAGSGPQGVAAVDIGGDGVPDLVTGNNGTGNLTLFTGVGDGTFAAGQTFPGGRGSANLAIADFNGDGHPDVAAVDPLQGTVSVSLNVQPGVTPTLSGSPTGSAIAGSKTRQNIKVRLASGDTINGTVTVDLALSTSPTFNTSDPVLATFSKKLKIKAGKSVTVTLPLKNYPDIAPGSYYLTGQATVGGLSNTTASSAPLTITAAI